VDIDRVIHDFKFLRAFEKLLLYQFGRHNESNNKLNQFVKNLFLSGLINRSIIPLGLFAL